MKKTGIWLALLPLALAGCSATTTMSSNDPQLHVKINDQAPLALSQPVSRTYDTTSFGQYQFKAYRADGSEMYGVMPLKFNGGYLAADILFFAPAAFFNLREVFPFYEFDVEAGVIRYKKNLNDAWTVYKPTPAEAQRAATYFGAGR